MSLWVTGVTDITPMHAFLIVGKTEKERQGAVVEILKQNKVGETLSLTSDKEVYSISSVRNLNKTLRLKTLDETTRAVVVKNAHRLTTEAANAFLKTLEEPTAHTILILTAPNQDSLLPTIVSRCQVENLGNSAPTSGKKEELEKLVNSSIGERLIVAEKFDDREMALEFVVEQTFAARDVMISSAKTDGASANTASCLKLLKDLKQAKDDLESNVNVKLVLVNLLLQYPIFHSTPDVE